MRGEDAARFKNIYREIVEHRSNDWARDAGYVPIYTASELSKIVVIGQAPGRKTQESQIPWDDASGKTLRQWLGVNDEEFYDPSKIALIPMDFYFPGKGKTGDLPPRKDFAPMWHPKLLNNMPHIQLTILIGQYAQKYYLDKRMKKNLTETVQAYEEYLPDFFPIVHSSPLNFRWHKNNPWFKTDTIPRLQDLVRSIL